MVFSSMEFLFLFLPIVLGAYYLTRWSVRRGWLGKAGPHAANAVLLLAGLFFYAWGERLLVGLLLLNCAWNYAGGLVIGRAAGGRRAQRIALIACIAANLAALCVFKYFNFGVDAYNALVTRLGLSGWVLTDVVRISLPIGISFYTFQAISYVVDVYRGTIPATRSLIDYCCYHTLFPQLVAGPIVRYCDVAEQLVDREVSRRRAAMGVSRFLVGLARKVLIANTLSVPADRIFALAPDQLSPAVAGLGVLCYSLQIYFDFSGYSDMAIGLGHMLGFRFLENFEHPYVSQSIREFWRRWHISLSTWFRDYLYVPLGGNRRGPLRTSLNLVLVFLLCGLWHGAAWNFVAWGLFHGAFLALERGPFGRLTARLWRPLRHAYALAVVMAGWVLFRSPTLAHAAAMLNSAFGLEPASAAARPVGFYLGGDVLAALALGMLFSTPISSDIALRWNAAADANRLPGARRVLARAALHAALASLLLVSVLKLSNGASNPFIYFRF